jgi:hypothetical protein
VCISSSIFVNRMCTVASIRRWCMRGRKDSTHVFRLACYPWHTPVARCPRVLSVQRDSTHVSATYLSMLLTRFAYAMI